MPALPLLARPQAVQQLQQAQQAFALRAGGGAVLPPQAPRRPMLPPQPQSPPEAAAAQLQQQRVSPRGMSFRPAPPPSSVLPQAPPPYALAAGYAPAAAPDSSASPFAALQTPFGGGALQLQPHHLGPSPPPGFVPPARAASGPAPAAGLWELTALTPQAPPEPLRHAATFHSALPPPPAQWAQQQPQAQWAGGGAQSPPPLPAWQQPPAPAAPEPSAFAAQLPGQGFQGAGLPTAALAMSRSVSLRAGEVPPSPLEALVPFGGGGDVLGPFYAMSTSAAAAPAPGPGAGSDFQAPR